jgi:hypothetical protein
LLRLSALAYVILALPVSIIRTIVVSMKTEPFSQEYLDKRFT